MALASDAHLEPLNALEREHEGLVPPRHRTNYFSHIWSGGYSAGYYAYIWAEVIDADAYAWFLEHGALTRENGQRFRDMILSHGGTGDVAVMYRAFRGRDLEIGPLLANRGLTARRGGPR
jgi:peptidyl-dipeptidase Dcp